MRLELEKLAIERERLKTETGLKTAELENKERAENDVTKLIKRYGDALAQVISSQPEEVTDLPAYFRGVKTIGIGSGARFVCSWPHPYSTLILGVFPLHQIAHVVVNERMGLKLFGREIIFEEFQPMWLWYLNVTDRRTDRRLITALWASIAR